MFNWFEQLLAGLETKMGKFCHTDGKQNGFWTDAYALTISFAEMYGWGIHSLHGFIEKKGTANPCEFVILKHLHQFVKLSTECWTVGKVVLPQSYSGIAL